MAQEVVDDRFEILSLAGEGGMGRVYRARDRRDGAVVALKVMREDASDTDAVVRFGREVEALARLDDPAIVRHVAHGATPKGTYLAMQWIDGEELRLRLRRGPLDVADTLTVATRIAGALAHAHARGILHRDVKPANVVLCGGRLEDATLIDFGLARTEDDELTRVGVMLGTPQYMAPEQIRGEHVLPSADTFALGCLVFHMLTGAPPFAAKGATAVLARVLFEEAASLSEIAPHVPAAFADLVAAMLRKSADQRPSMQDVLEELQRVRTSISQPMRAVHATEALSVGEQRIVSVVVSGEPTTSDEDVTLRYVPGPAPRAADRSRLQAIAARFEARLTPLPNGALIAVLTTAGSATDLALRAAELAFELKRELRAPIGLATGRAETEGRLPMGEAIDRASALAPFHGDAVRVDAMTAALLDDRFVPESTDEGTLVRKQRELGAVRTLLGKPTPCVGRDAELAMLEGILAQCVSESVARVVVVTAGAGFGKSRLRHEFLRRVRARGDEVQIWTARGDSVGGGAPFGMLAQMIRSTARILEGEPPLASRDKLRARVDERTPDEARHRVATFLAEMIDVRVGGEGDVQLQAARRDALLMGDQMRRAFVDFVDAESAAGPLMLVLEDLHWGDLPTVGALDAVLRAFPERAIFVVALARPEVNERFPDLWSERAVQPIPLASLPKRAAERLVNAALGATPREIAERMIEQAAGNVFYLEELIRANAEGRDAPPTVVAMVQSRLAALEAPARRVLRAASVFGETFWAGGVRALLGGDAEGEAKRWLQELEWRELCTRRAESRIANEAEYVFRHALVREGAYAMLTDADRALGHRIAAEWLEHAGETAAIVVAEHYARGGDPVRASHGFLRAAQDSLERNDLASAIERAERGAGSGAEGSLLGALRNVQAHAHHWRGETAKMERAAAEAVALLPRETAEWADAVATLAVAKQRLGRSEELESLAGELTKMLSQDRGDRSSLARAGARVASLLFFAGRQERASSVLDVAEVAASNGGSEVRARVHQARAPRARQAGRPSEALDHLTAAERAFREAGDEPNTCSMMANRGFALSELGAYAEAKEVLLGALALAEKLGLALVAATAKSNLGVVLLRLGRAGEAEAMERAALATLEAQDRRQEGCARVYLSTILREAGSLPEAEAEARAALRLLEAAPALRPFAGAALAAVLLASGRTTEALDAATEAARWHESGRNLEEGDALLRLVHARALVATGDRAAGVRRILDARGRLQERAATIADESLRRSFLESVPEHSMTMKLASTWSAGSVPATPT